MNRRNQNPLLRIGTLLLLCLLGFPLACDALGDDDAATGGTGGRPFSVDGRGFTDGNPIPMKTGGSGDGSPFRPSTADGAPGIDGSPFTPNQGDGTGFMNPNDFDAGEDDDAGQ
jgi:hypothetical protein